jgi:hypothetical protein
VLKKEELGPFVNENTRNKGLFSTDGRRHSARIRPPTTKALESLVFGLFGTKKLKDNNEMNSCPMKEYHLFDEELITLICCDQC